MPRNFFKRWAIQQALWVVPCGILALVLDSALLAGAAITGGAFLIILLFGLMLPKRWW